MRITTLLVAISLLMANPALAQQQRTKTPVKRTAAPASLRSPPAAPVPAQPATPAPAPTATAATVTPTYQRTQTRPAAPARQDVVRQEVATESQPTGKSGVFKLNVFSPIISTVSAFFERPLSPTSSAQLGFYYTGAGIGDISLRGFGITPEYRFYLSKSHDAPDGAYLAPYVRFQSLTFTDKTDNTTGVQFTTVGGGLLIGRQWLLGRQDNVALDLFLGPSYGVTSATIKGENTIPSAISGFGIRFGLALGLAW